MCRNLKGGTLIVPNDSHEIFSTSKGREIFALLFESSCTGVGAGGLLSLEVRCEFRITFIIFAFFTVSIYANR